MKLFVPQIFSSLKVDSERFDKQRWHRACRARQRAALNAAVRITEAKDVEEAFDDFNLITNFTAVAATFNNIGPGLELVGPTGNFGMFSWFSKLVLTFDMLAGRLEIFPLLLLFVRDTWRKF